MKRFTGQFNSSSLCWNCGAVRLRLCSCGSVSEHLSALPAPCQHRPPCCYIPWVPLAAPERKPNHKWATPHRTDRRGRIRSRGAWTLPTKPTDGPSPPEISKLCVFMMYVVISFQSYPWGATMVVTVGSLAFCNGRWGQKFCTSRQFPPSQRFLVCCVEPFTGCFKYSLFLWQKVWVPSSPDRRGNILQPFYVSPSSSPTP